MTEFTFDTSGEVGPLPPGPYNERFITFPDLDPFTQGYVRAAARSLWLWLQCGAGGHSEAHAAEIVAFRNWAPATLEAMMKDCAEFQGVPERRWINTEVAGSEWFNCRQRGDYARVGFPPLTLYLGDDGLVYQRTT